MQDLSLYVSRKEKKNQASALLLFVARLFGNSAAAGVRYPPAGSVVPVLASSAGQLAQGQGPAGGGPARSSSVVRLAPAVPAQAGQHRVFVGSPAGQIGTTSKWHGADAFAYSQDRTMSAISRDNSTKPNRPLFLCLKQMVIIILRGTAG